MSGRIEARLKELDIVLPAAPTPIANFVPFKRSGSVLFVAGQTPKIGGKDVFVGKLGKEISVQEGQAAARLCAVNIVAQLKTYLDDLDRVAGCIRLGGFVNATPDFMDHPAVVNGASDLIVAIFGDAGRHVRVAIGCSSLPRNVPVEVEGTFDIS